MINGITQNTPVKTSIFYINDFHGKSINMERVISASKNFDIRHKNDLTTDTFKLSSGDIMLGEDKNKNLIAAKFQNFIGISESAAGNHEFDLNKDITNILPEIKFNILAANIKNKNQNPWSNVIKSSVIEKRNGHQYGIIGAGPIDLLDRSKKGFLDKSLYVENTKETIKTIQNEVNKLTAKGINKIILLSHLGNNIDKYIAQKTSGIDIILGGHSHELIEGVKSGENLLYGLNSEPVIITQAGRDGRNFGILNLEFNSKGQITKIQNNIEDTRNYRRFLPAKKIFDKISGQKEIYGIINKAPAMPGNELTDANAHAYFIADCMKKELNADIALLPAANIRGYFEKGEVDSRTLSDILPFKNKLFKVNYTEKELVEALKIGAKSLVSTANKPGIFYPSGLEYSIDKNGELLSLKFIDKTGNIRSININNPDEKKLYSTIINDYCALGNDGFTMLNKPERIIRKYDFDGTKCVEDFMKKINNPINIEDDGRIKFI